MEPLKIGTEFKNHRIIFKDPNVKPILITERQHDDIWERVNNSSREDWIRIKDSSNGNVLFEGKIGAIVKMEEIRTEQTTGRKGICMYGGRHNIDEKGVMNCHCREYIGASPDQFQKWIRNKHPKIMYDGDITEEIRKSYLKSNQ